MVNTGLVAYSDRKVAWLIYCAAKFLASKNKNYARLKGDGMNWKNWKGSHSEPGRQSEATKQNDGDSPPIRISISGSGVASVNGADILKSKVGQDQLKILKSIKERR
jgi:hypothetical protein